MVCGYQSHSESYLESERAQLEDELQSEEDCEDDVQYVEESRVGRRLPVEFHRERNRVHENHHENRVLEKRRRHECPELEKKEHVFETHTRQFRK